MKIETGTVIHGTHRNQDLIPAFLDALREIAPTHYAQFVVDNPIPAYAMEDDSAEFWTDDVTFWITDELVDLLNEHAPEGYYFGTHPGDGSDFGFWEVE